MGAKLIRDKMDELPWRDPEAKKYLRLVKNETEYIALLNQKLLEEVGELIAADDFEQVVAELADVAEVIESMKKLVERSWNLRTGTVQAAQDAKREERGSFDKGLVWDVSAYTFEG